MTSPRPPWWFFISTFGLCLIFNASLGIAWRNDPSNRFGAVAFLLWFVACILLSYKHPTPRLPLWLLSLSLLVLGEIGSLQVLKHLAFALLLPSLCGNWGAFALMTLAAVAWTPAWGWLFHLAVGNPLDILRPFFVIFAFLFARIFFNRHDPS